LSTATSGAGRLDRQHPRGQLQHRELARAGHAARFDHAVGLRRGAAGEDHAGSLFSVRQGLLLVHAVDHAAFEQAALAGAAGTVAAAIGQADALADGGGEDGFVAFDGEAALRGLQGDGQAHGGGGRGGT
jgi:hypothetical protein